MSIRQVVPDNQGHGKSVQAEVSRSDQHFTPSSPFTAHLAKVHRSFEAEEEADRLRYEADPESAFMEDNFSILDESDHLAVASVNAFLQNLYFYATEHNDEFRNHMLVETLLIPRLLLSRSDSHR